MEFIALSLLVVLAGVAIAFYASIKSTKQVVVEHDEEPEGLSIDGQSYYRPIRRLNNEIRTLLVTSKDPAIQAMSAAIREELIRTNDKVVKALQTRDALRKSFHSRDEELRTIQQVMKKDDTNESLQKASDESRATYEHAKEMVVALENEADLAKVALTQLKAKIEFTSANVSSTERADELRETLGSLNTMKVSVDEAQQFLRG